MECQEPTIKELQNICCHAASLSLLRELFPRLTEARIRRLLKQAGVRYTVGRQWSADLWLKDMEQENAAHHNNIIIRHYEQALSSLRNAIHDQHCLERKAALATIDHYLTSLEKPYYEADGVYAVIAYYRQGLATAKRCPLGHDYWTFKKSLRCPECWPWYIRICKTCAKMFFVDAHARGRKRLHCPSCKPPRVLPGTAPRAPTPVNVKDRKK